MRGRVGGGWARWSEIEQGLAQAGLHIWPHLPNTHTSRQGHGPAASVLCSHHATLGKCGKEELGASESG